MDAAKLDPYGLILHNLVQLGGFIQEDWISQSARGTLI